MRQESSCGTIRRTGSKGDEMAPITVSVEIARPPEQVFAYVTDPSHLSEWQDSVIRVDRKGTGPASEGDRVGLTRRVGRSREIDMTAEVTEVHPPLAGSSEVLTARYAG